MKLMIVSYSTYVSIEDLVCSSNFCMPGPFEVAYRLGEGMVSWTNTLLAGFVHLFSAFILSTLHLSL